VRLHQRIPQLAHSLDLIHDLISHELIHHQKQLKRSGAGRHDLLCFYTTVIRPVLEYACPAWHLSLTTAQSRTLESLQRRAMRIMYADDDYTFSLIMAGQDTLESRRTQP